MGDIIIFNFIFNKVKNRQVNKFNNLLCKKEGNITWEASLATRATMEVASSLQAGSPFARTALLPRKPAQSTLTACLPGKAALTALFPRKEAILPLLTQVILGLRQVTTLLTQAILGLRQVTTHFLPKQAGNTLSHDSTASQEASVACPNSTPSREGSTNSTISQEGSNSPLLTQVILAQVTA